MVVPISKARIIPVMKALYCALLLMEVKSNFNACSRMEVSSTDNAHCEWEILLDGQGGLDYKVSQSLRLDAPPQDVLDVVFQELYYQIYHSSFQVEYFVLVMNLAMDNCSTLLSMANLFFLPTFHFIRVTSLVDG